MGIHSRHTRILAVVGMLALGAASAARAQDTTHVQAKDTSAAARSDTSGYRSYQNSDTLRSDSSGFKYNGPPTDTTLKAKPGAQTGRNAGDSANAAGNVSDSTSSAGATDTVVCKDGSNGVVSACNAAHGGIDSVATKAAKKARGQSGTQDYNTPKDTSSSNPQ